MNKILKTPVLGEYFLEALKLLVRYKSHCFLNFLSFKIISVLCTLFDEKLSIRNSVYLDFS